MEILAVVMIVLVFVGLPFMVARQNEYAKYVEKCEKKHKTPLDYKSWKASTGRGGIV